MMKEQSQDDQLSQGTTPLKIAINPYCTLLLVVGVSLVAIHCVLNYLNHEVIEVPWLIQQLFDLDEENNLPTWFSSFLLLNCAIVLFVSLPSHSAAFKWQWRLLAFGFLVLSIDEVAGLHESFHTAIDINWAIPGGILVLIVGSTFVPFLLSLPRRTAIRFVLSGTIYVAGAIVVEWLSRDMDEDAIAYGFATALEESLEMLGTWLFLKWNLEELQDTRFHVSIIRDQKASVTGIVD